MLDPFKLVYVKIEKIYHVPGKIGHLKSESDALSAQGYRAVLCRKGEHSTT